MTNKTEWEGHTPLQVAGTHTDLPEWWDIIDTDGRTKPYTLLARAKSEGLAHKVVHCVNNFPALEAERDALRAVLKSLARWFDADDEVLDAMSQDELADHNRQVDKISKALAISEKSE